MAELNYIVPEGCSSKERDRLIALQLSNQKKNACNSLCIEQRIIDEQFKNATAVFDEAKRTYEIERLRYRNGLQLLNSKRMEVNMRYDQVIARCNLSQNYKSSTITKAIRIALEEYKKDIEVHAPTNEEYFIALNFLNNTYGVWGSDELDEWCSKYINISKDETDTIYLDSTYVDDVV